MSCDSCSDSTRGLKLALENARINAKMMADEVHKPQAICEEEATGEVFVLDAFRAFAERFKVLQVVSGSPADAGHVPELPV